MSTKLQPNMLKVPAWEKEVSLFTFSLIEGHLSVPHIM